MEEKITKRMKEKGKSKLFRMVFGRTFFLAFAVSIQIAILLIFIYWLSEYFVYFYSVSTILSIILAIHITGRDINPSYKIAWLFMVLLVPVLGGSFYVLIKIHPSTYKIKKKLNIILADSRKYIPTNKKLMEDLKSDDELYGLANYIDNYGGYPAYKNTSVKYFSSGENKFESMLEELENAKEFIFLEYYIVDEGIMWDAILEILCRKVKEGVEVRFMYDGMCTLNLLPQNYPRFIREFSIKCKVFSPIRPAISSHQNNRDHRKILVIDGKTAYTGGINLADEYINAVKKFGHWKDTAVMLKGEAVRNFTVMFLQNWNISEETVEDFSPYLREYKVSSTGYVIPYGDSPFDHENVGELVYMDILNNARDYVHIMTPYLILDNEMILCMEYAAKRGVDVKLILPHVTDNPSAYTLARNLYPRLIQRGIKIYEYTPGFVHAKVFVSDNKKAVVGTINMDYRSMYLNMECACYFQDMNEVSEVEKDFACTLAMCEEITLDNCKKYSVVKQKIGKILWLFSPLM